MKSITVTIGGKELSLRGEDDQAILRAAEHVNTTMKAIQQRQQDQSTSTVSVLTALNIAEQLEDKTTHYEKELTLICDELYAMSSFLEQASSATSE
jgi:cell division protein ZapA (FtsZ GTPase activity inhibitor)